MKYLGINTKATIPQNEVIDALSRLFLAEIPLSHVQRIVNALATGNTTYAKIVDFTAPHLQSLKTNSSDKNWHKRMKNRGEEWEKTFGRIKVDDFDYIAERYEVTYLDVFGVPQFASPEEMASYIKSIIKGQNSAIEQLAVPFFQHYAKRKYGFGCPMTKPVLLCGPTGSGKTEMLNSFSEICDGPFITINSSECTPTGWKGASFEDVLADKVRKYGRTEVENAIIFIDEIDKITHTGCGKETDDMGYDIMRFMMNLTDPRNSIRLNNGFGKNGEQSFIELPISNMLIVFSGAFSGIEKMIKKRLNLTTGVGFACNTSLNLDKQQNIYSHITSDDLQKWGFLSEFTGRLGQIITLNPLGEDEMYQILTESKNSILTRQISYTRNLYNAKLRFTETALRLICKKAAEQGLGFRGVQTIFASCLNSLYYKLPVVGRAGRTIEVDEIYIEKQLKTL